jgi:pimeloyl-ACP methyl ester carboxylesterase
MIYSAATALREVGYPGPVIERAARLRRAVDAYYAGKKSRKEVAALLTSARSEPWYELTYLPHEPPRDLRSTKRYHQFAFDPAESIAKVKAPVLLLFADRDPWIPVTSPSPSGKTEHGLDRSPDTRHESLHGGHHRATHDLDPEPFPRCTRAC